MQKTRKPRAITCDGGATNPAYISGRPLTEWL
jgi:hypothetical protein